MNLKESDLDSNLQDLMTLFNNEMKHIKDYISTPISSLNTLIGPYKSDHEFFKYYINPKEILEGISYIKLQYDYLWTNYSIERYTKLVELTLLYRKWKVIIHFLFLFYNSSLEKYKHQSDILIIPDEYKNEQRYFYYRDWLDSDNIYRSEIFKAALEFITLDLEDVNTFDNWSKYIHYKDKDLWRDDVIKIVIKTVLQTIVLIYRDNNEIKDSVKKCLEILQQNYDTDESEILNFSEEVQAEYFKTKADISHVQFIIVMKSLARIISNLKHRLNELIKEQTYQKQIIKIGILNHENEIAFIKETQKQEKNKDKIAKLTHQLEILQTSTLLISKRIDILQSSLNININLPLYQSPIPEKIHKIDDDEQKDEQITNKRQNLKRMGAEKKLKIKDRPSLQRDPATRQLDPSKLNIKIQPQIMMSQKAPPKKVVKRTLLDTTMQLIANTKKHRQSLPPTEQQPIPAPLQPVLTVHPVPIQPVLEQSTIITPSPVLIVPIQPVLPEHLYRKPKPSTQPNILTVQPQTRSVLIPEPPVLALPNDIYLQEQIGPDLDQSFIGDDHQHYTYDQINNTIHHIDPHYSGQYTTLIQLYGVQYNVDRVSHVINPQVNQQCTLILEEMVSEENVYIFAGHPYHLTDHFEQITLNNVYKKYKYEFIRHQSILYLITDNLPQKESIYIAPDNKLRRRDNNTIYPWKCLFHNIPNRNDLYYLDNKNELFDVSTKNFINLSTICIEAVNKYKTICIKDNHTLRHLTQRDTTAYSDYYEYNGIKFELLNNNEIGEYMILYEIPEIDPYLLISDSVDTAQMFYFSNNTQKYLYNFSSNNIIIRDPKNIVYIGPDKNEYNIVKKLNKFVPQPLLMKNKFIMETVDTYQSKQYTNVYIFAGKPYHQIGNRYELIEARYNLYKEGYFFLYERFIIKIIAPGVQDIYIAPDNVLRNINTGESFKWKSVLSGFDMNETLSSKNNPRILNYFLNNRNELCDFNTGHTANIENNFIYSDRKIKIAYIQQNKKYIRRLNINDTSPLTVTNQRDTEIYYLYKKYPFKLMHSNEVEGAYMVLYKSTNQSGQLHGRDIFQYKNPNTNQISALRQNVYTYKLTLKKSG